MFVHFPYSKWPSAMLPWASVSVRSKDGDGGGSRKGQRHPLLQNPTVVSELWAFYTKPC